MKSIVLGNGAWGTALAVCLVRNGHDTTLWCHDPQKAEQIRLSRTNPRLPQCQLPSELTVTSDLRAAESCSLVVIAVPSSAIRSVCGQVTAYLREDATLVSATKGLESGTLLRMSEIVEQVTQHTVVVLTGPTHAEEVSSGIPSACLAACSNRVSAELVQDAFMSDVFRIYTSPDVIGAELGGAMKNVIALCAGISDGLGYGDNSKAMLMTRGLTEIARLGLSMNAGKDTLAGLAGVGDLIVTCTSMHSRNRRAGILIGQGVPPQEAMKQVGAVVEGYFAAKSVWELCCQKHVEMPILRAAYQVLYENVPADKAVKELLTRQKKAETEHAGWDE